MVPRSSDDGDNRPREIEYEVQDRFALLAREFRAIFYRSLLVIGCIIHPDNRVYQFWKHFIMIWAVCSICFTPLEFGFFRGLSEDLFFFDIFVQIVFFIDIIIEFYIAYHITYNRTSITLRYFMFDYIIDFLSCLPWDYIYKFYGRKEQMRYLLWLRLCRMRKMDGFFQKMEKNIHINYFSTRILKLFVVGLYCTHLVACLFYYISTTQPHPMGGYTWIGSLTLGDYSYRNFWELDLWKCYITSLYFCIMTLTTVGYGDIHPVNIKEMVFIRIYISFCMILGAYLNGNLTALIVKGSKTQRFRDKMKNLTKYMNENKLEKGISEQIKRHVRLQYESSYTEAFVLQDKSDSIDAKISESSYKPYIENVLLFKGCSSAFIRQIVIRLQEEFFLPGEVILEQGNAVHQLYFVCHGLLEGVRIGEDGAEETISEFGPNSSFGEIAILCNLPQPFYVRVCELCRLLHLDNLSFTNILKRYFVDARIVLSNLLEGGANNAWIKQLESDITQHFQRQESERALLINSAASYGELNQLKDLIRSSADLKKTDYYGRSPLHIAASRGHVDITTYLLQVGMDINATDEYGSTPLLEAIKCEHDSVVSLLFNEGAKLGLKDTGSQLCKAVSRGDSGFLKRVLSCGVDPNSKDYDHRTPLHIAACEGLYLIAEVLLKAGASVFVVDRWGTTPLEEARKRGSSAFIKIFEDAVSKELLNFPDRSQEVRDNTASKMHDIIPFPSMGPH